MYKRRVHELRLTSRSYSESSRLGASVPAVIAAIVKPRNIDVFRWFDENRSIGCLREPCFDRNLRIPVYNVLGRTVSTSLSEQAILDSEGPLSVRCVTISLVARTWLVETDTSFLTSNTLLSPGSNLQKTG